MGIGPNPQSPIPNPQSPNPHIFCEKRLDLINIYKNIFMNNFLKYLKKLKFKFKYIKNEKISSQ